MECSVDQARELHDHFKSHTKSGAYAYEGWQQVIQPRLEELDAVFTTRAQEFSRFRIQIFEWELGL